MSPQERAAKVRELLARCASGVLCTQSERMEGFPYGSVAPFAVDAHGSPFFFLSGLAVHTKNLQANAKASLLVNEEAVGLDGGRANLFGEVLPVADEALIADLRARYLAPSRSRTMDRLRRLRLLPHGSRQHLLGRRLRRHGLGAGRRLSILTQDLYRIEHRCSPRGDPCGAYHCRQRTRGYQCIRCGIHGLHLEQQRFDESPRRKRARQSNQ